jgi:histidinol-phosphate/aromatic aminotransferase/cobyric acid decarboxylase-like protein
LVNVANARQVCGKLRDLGIYVRDCTSFGLPEFLRVSPRRAADNLQLLDALDRIGATRGIIQTRA